MGLFDDQHAGHAGYAGVWFPSFSRLRVFPRIVSSTPIHWKAIINLLLMA